MSQTDMNVTNASGSAVRADINAHLDAIATNNSGGTEPTTKFANQWWGDTATNILKRRNNANTAWISALDLTSGNLIGIDVQAYDADTAKLDVAQLWTAQQRALSAALTYNATQTWNCGAAQDATLTLTGNITTFSAPTNQVSGTHYSLRLIGAFTVTTWNAVFNFPGDVDPILTASATKADILTFRSDGTNMELTGISQDI